MSLFPFLSVLACVIGTLTLMIAGLTIAEMGGSEHPRAIEYEGLTVKIETDRQAASEIESLIAQVLSARKLLKEARAELERLKAKQRALGKEKAEVLHLCQQIARLRERIQKLEEELRRLEREIRALQAALKGIPDRSKPPIHIGIPEEDAGRGFLGGRGRVRPTFVECTSDAIIIHPDSRRIRKWSIASDQRFRSLLQRTKSRGDEMVVFLIRPDGVKTFVTASQAAQRQNVTAGALPLPGYGKIDCSAFQTGK